MRTTAAKSVSFITTNVQVTTHTNETFLLENARIVMAEPTPERKPLWLYIGDRISEAFIVLFMLYFIFEIWSAWSGGAVHRLLELCK